ncbi:MAG: thiolase family protein [Pseudomonadales bacterium]|jgi:acetyl-CoA acetyltransferase family protein|nr:thiolase family protein [Pseudomonadales bacterium]MDP6471076.1 thiolase family protein [Pseudomonadales bacterium]MDP6825738.1 thiolase family protein [Pseudomonadales bacterium]MDP6970709.1 thiolase family protein [Pseudomonadales bacterium]
MSQVVVVDSIRTGLAKAHRGTFNLTRSDDLVAHCIDFLLERNPELAAEEVDDVILGCGRQVGEQSGNVARHAVVLSQLPITVPATTISRACSSGLNSIAFAANQLANGCAEVMMAGGVESITGLDRGSPAQFEENPRLMEEKPDIFMAMGNTAEVVARRYQVSREAQDAYSLQSQQRYVAAVEAGYMAEEIAPMTVDWRKVVDKDSGATEIVEGIVDHDECNRPTTTLEGLSKLSPAFEEDGTVTAGNASQLSDGASMAILMTEERAQQLDLEPMGYFGGFTVAGCEPDEMGIGPVFAIPKLLDYKGLSLADIDLVELNEAFASQCLYCRDRLGIDPEIYNVNGGSIAIGHPFGMTGARLTGSLLREMKRREKKLGIVSMCIGKGMGAAGLFEAC